MGNKSYDENFYADQRNRSRLSASKIVPFILDSLVPLKIESVVDFGCGVGGWLAEFKSCNSTMEVKGLDFGNANTEQFFIDVNNEFEKTNLTLKIDLKRRFDIAISVECAEHLEKRYADTFVDNICRHADIIMFGAAIPGQGGVEHVNEQPQSYWIRKFRDRDYKCYDVIRPRFWNDEDIECWYRQNTFLFVKNTVDLSETKLTDYKESMSTDVANPKLVRLLRAEITAFENHLINKRYLKKIEEETFVFKVRLNGK